jgi:hypothetical protein
VSVHQLSEAELHARALDHPCRDFGARTGVRCRIITKTIHGRTKVDVRSKKPCADRARIAWREMLAGHV